MRSKNKNFLNIDRIQSHSGVGGEPSDYESENENVLRYSVMGLQNNFSENLAIVVCPCNNIYRSIQVQGIWFDQKNYWGSILPKMSTSAIERKIAYFKFDYLCLCFHEN